MLLLFLSLCFSLSHAACHWSADPLVVMGKSFNLYVRFDVFQKSDSIKIGTKTIGTNDGLDSVKFMYTNNNTYVVTIPNMDWDSYSLQYECWTKSIGCWIHPKGAGIPWVYNSSKISVEGNHVMVTKVHPLPKNCGAVEYNSTQFDMVVTPSFELAMFYKDVKFVEDPRKDCETVECYPITLPPKKNCPVPEPETKSEPEPETKSEPEPEMMDDDDSDSVTWWWEYLCYSLVGVALVLVVITAIIYKKYHRPANGKLKQDNELGDLQRVDSGLMEKKNNPRDGVDYSLIKNESTPWQMKVD